MFIFQFFLNPKFLIHTYMYWNYIIFAIITYLVLYKYLLINEKDSIKGSLILVVLFILLNNYSEYFTGNMPLYTQEYKKIPNLNTAPDISSNKQFQMHDGAMNSYRGFYPANSIAPPQLGSNALQQQDNFKYTIPNCTHCR